MSKEVEYYQLCGASASSEKAICVEGVWFPKSQVIIVNNLDDNRTNNTVYVPTWLFMKSSDAKRVFGYIRNSWTLNELLEEYKYNQLHNGSGQKIWDCEVVFKGEVVLNTEKLA